jgi:curved DNA-binding protein CbpA
MPKKDKDYYAILHLDPSADAKMVEHAYWHLARALQAAAHTDPSAYERLERLNEAYSVLGTPALRAEYDRARRSTPPEPAPEEPKEPREAERPAPTVPVEKPRTATRVSLRTVAVPSWQGAVTAGSLFAVAIVALLAGASPTLVLPLLAAGMALALVPTLRRLPSVPASARFRLSAPLRRWRAPRADFPRPSGAHTRPTAPRVTRPAHRRQPAIDAADLRASTAATIARWRKGAEAAPPLRPGSSSEEATPSGGAGDDPPPQP